MEGSPMLVLTGAIVLAFLVGTRGGRALVMIVVAVVACVTAYSIFVRTVSCPRTDEPCLIPVQPTIYGPCSASEGAGLLRVDGMYHLTAPAGVDARATCFSLVGQ